MSASATPLVSIVMAAYQAGKHLATALDSALAQSHPRLEIIVVDDGSTDSTAAILDDYRRRHGIVVIHQANAGQSAALNRGLAEARGDYVKFFDADDILSPAAVALQVAALSRQPPDRLAFGEWARFHTSPEECEFVPRPGYHDGPPLEWLLATWADAEPMYQCALWLIPRTLLARAGGWDARLGLINDLEFFTRLVLASAGVVHTPGARLCYRSGLPGSLSRQTSPRALESAHLSCRLAVAHVLAAEDSPRTRRACADALFTFVQAHYPSSPRLMRDALDEAARLGGSSIRPGGGLAFRLLCRVLGWRAALVLRRLRHRSRVRG